MIDLSTFARGGFSALFEQGHSLPKTLE